ncbi:MAG: Carboxypeptidase regulatory-like domain, partial [Gemmatimonadaceae bacterium]|nr:Carboxypeptidase regulatory-like domain [Gemmatimonadaceae bacterium]
MQFSFTRNRAAVARASLIVAALLTFSSSIGAANPVRTANADITGVVTDAGSGQPLPSAEVSIMRGTEVVFNASTDAFGRYRLHNISTGSYTVTARFLG